MTRAEAWEAWPLRLRGKLLRIGGDGYEVVDHWLNRNWRVFGTGPTPEAAIAAALGVEVAEDPQALALAEVVAELERERDRRERIAPIQTHVEGEIRLNSEAEGIDYALALLRRAQGVTPDE